MDRIEQLIDAVVKALYGELGVKINLVQAPKETGVDLLDILEKIAKEREENGYK